jgi:hypothetical protein
VLKVRQATDTKAVINEVAAKIVRKKRRTSAEIFRDKALKAVPMRSSAVAANDDDNIAKPI